MLLAASHVPSTPKKFAIALAKAALLDFREEIQRLPPKKLID